MKQYCALPPPLSRRARIEFFESAFFALCSVNRVLAFFSRFELIANLKICGNFLQKTFRQKLKLRWHFLKLYFTKVSTLFHTNNNKNDEKTGDFLKSDYSKAAQSHHSKTSEQKKNFEKFLASKKTFRVWQWLTASGATFRAKRLERSDWGMHRRRSIMRFWINLRKFTKRVWTWELIEEPLFCCFLFVVGCQHRCRSINKKQISLFGLTFDLCKSVVWVSRLRVSSLELKHPKKKFINFPQKLCPKIFPIEVRSRFERV